MQQSPTGSIIEQAKADTASHLRFLHQSIRFSLMFITIIIIVNAINVMAFSVQGRSAEYVEEILSLSPNPILLISLLISAWIHIFLLHRIRVNFREIRSDSNYNEEAGKSVTDVNYDIIRAVSISLKIWPFIAILFIIYFIGCLSMLIELVLGIGSDISVDYSTAPNLLSLLISIYFFTVQTVNWKGHRTKIKELERLERQIVDELKV